MVQFNLLPDVKLKFIKSQKTKRMVTAVSVIVSLASLGVLAMALFTVYFVQKQMISSLDTSIKKSNAELESIEDVDKILTVQNQLSTLTGLHESKPAVSRVFTYLQQTTPDRVSINKLTIDFEAGTIAFGGVAPTLDDVKNYADALKGSTYKLDGNESNSRAFTDVVLGSFTRDGTKATYTITAKYNPDLFDTTKQVELARIADASEGGDGPFNAEEAPEDTTEGERR